MTKEAVAASRQVRAELDEVIRSLSDDEWVLPSACPGWRIRDIVAHLSVNAKEAIDPTPASETDPPLPENRERLHDLRVDERRPWSIDQLLDEYDTYTSKFLGLLADLQEEPMASESTAVAGLGTFPLHAFANADVFDVYCHLRIDILRPRGPIDRNLAEPTQEMLYSGVQWMMWELPQIAGLDETVTAPITIELTSSGASWTVNPAEPGSPLVVEEGAGGTVTVTSSAHDFIIWGTKRDDWRTHCKLSGDATLAEPFLDALNII